LKKHKYSTISEINVTSLVDVTMVLLIIFMITAPLLQSGIEVQLPKSKSDALKPHEGVTVTLDQSGHLYLNGEKTDATMFEVRLLQAYQTSGKKTVLLLADKNIPYGSVIGVMDRIKGVGIHNLGLIVEPGTEPKDN
jgi:biopolymer transport protein TolR